MFIIQRAVESTLFSYCTQALNIIIIMKIKTLIAKFRFESNRHIRLDVSKYWILFKNLKNREAGEDQEVLIAQ